jgi:uridine kinase
MSSFFTIGITGGSGSGKTYFIKNLANRFSETDICLLSQDHYYKPLALQFVDTNGVQNFDLPSALDRDRFHEDIQKLKKGETIRIPEYTFNNPSAEPKVLEFKPAPIIIVEGLFVQYFEEIADELDLKLFIDAKDYLKLSRRILRDSEERGYDLNDVLYRYQHHVMPVYESLIKPLKYKADLVIPNNHHFEHALDILTLALKGKLEEMRGSR